MNLLLPGMHVAADSALHRLDPRVKMGAALLLMALPFAASGLPAWLLLSAFVGLLIVFSKVPFPALLRTLRTIFWLGFFMFFFYFFTTPGRTLVAFWGVTVTWEGLLRGTMQIYRLGLLVIVSALLTFTTSPSQLTHGLEAALGPLGRLGLPVRELAMVLTIALRFVPTLFDEVDKITKAQRARGVDVRGQAPWHQVRRWVPTFVPLFVAAFRRADALALAMEARGFRGARRRTRLHQLRLTGRDWLAAVVVLLVALTILALGRI
jgi:energy-coupling factor transport system permease protein